MGKLRPTIWGPRARLRFSNAFGTRPLVLDAAFIGLQLGGGTVAPGSNQPLRFGGATRLTLPPGRDAWSDQVALPFVTEAALPLLAGPQLVLPFSAIDFMKKKVLPVFALRWGAPGGRALLVAGALLLADLTLGYGSQLQAAPVGAAPTVITLHAKDKSAAFLLREIERQTSYAFIYSDNRLDKRLRQTVDLVNVPLEVALEQVLRPLGMDYRIVGKQIILTNRRGAALPPTAPLSGSVATLGGGGGAAPARPLPARRIAARPISGHVTARDGSGPLPGVNVLVKGSNVGTATNAEGFYTLEVPDGPAVLVFSYIGFASQEVAVDGQTSIDAALAPEAKTLGDVVVTGFGLTRERRSLGYSVQDIKGSELTEVREPNPLNALAGKLAGVQINRNGSGPAGATNIIIRGYNSLTRDSRPLIVVDGVPIDV